MGGITESVRDVDAKVAWLNSAATPEQIDALHKATKIVLTVERWEQIVATFPAVPTTLDEWRAVWGTYDYGPVLRWREQAKEIVRKERLHAPAIRDWYRDKPIEFTEHWGTTYDPRNAGTNRPVKMPMLLFPRQREFMDFLSRCLKEEAHGLGEKVRDFGASWLGIFFSINLWCCTPGASVGWGSRKEQLVDNIGDADSIFEKIRMAIRELPWFLMPDAFSDSDDLTFMKCVNRETGATITGESGDNIGRGGRSLIYFKDESAHYARPDLIEASLGDNTRVQIDISTPNGLGNVFHRRRKAGTIWIGGPMEKNCANIFIMDWRDHPAKDQAWYDERRAKAVNEGLLHKFKQEVDRDYAASVEGIIIKPEWVEAAIDAHIKLGLDDSGGWSTGLDVGDNFEGDGNAWAAFKGIVLRHADAWGDIDGGAATRRALQLTEEARIPDTDLQYDCIGVGATVKAEANRLAETFDDYGLPLLPEGIRLIPWAASAGPLNPDENIYPDDRESPINKDFFANLKAQAWWMIARRFENTWRAIHEGISFEPHQLISIDSRIPMLHQLKDELSQPVMKKRPGDMKLLVDKTPDGTKSPNLGDATIMAAWPVEATKPVYTTAIPEFQIPPFAVPPHWPRAFAMKVEEQRTFALWSAYDVHQRTLYILTEHARAGADATTNIAAIKSRGDWIPGVIHSDETNLKARQAMGEFYTAGGLDLVLADMAVEAGINDVNGMVSTGRLKIFSACTGVFRAYAAFRRDGEGKMLGGGGLMDCLRLLARPSTLSIMRVKPKFEMVKQPIFNAQGSHRGDKIGGY